MPTKIPLMEKKPVLQFICNAAAITVSISLSGGAPTPQWIVAESDGTVYTYAINAFNHIRVAPGDMMVKLVNTWALRPYVTRVQLASNGIKSTFRRLHLELFPSLQVIELYGNPLLTGDVSGFNLPSGLQTLRLYTTGLSGSVSNWVLPANLVWLQIHSTSIGGDVSEWELPNTLQYFFADSSLISGDISGWVLPPTLVYFIVNSSLLSGNISAFVLPASLVYFSIHTTAISGSMNGWTIPAATIYFFVHETLVSGVPSFASAVDLAQFYCDNCGMNQATVDAILEGIYDRKATFTAAGPVAHVGGTNAAPSGIYQAQCPPVTGKEFAFELVNDSCGVGGPNWIVTFTP